MLRRSLTIYDDLLKFLNLRAQASETCSGEPKRHHPLKKANLRSAAAFVANTAETEASCSLCKTQKHPLYACPQFKVLSHDKMLSTVRSSNMCLNCLKSSKDCKSNNCCRKCQKLHHTLLHNDSKQAAENREHPTTIRERVESSSLAVAPMVSNNAQYGSGSVLLMTCQKLVYAPDGTYIQARGLLDSGSSISFVSERLAQFLRLPLSTQHIRISGITGVSRGFPLQSIATLTISHLLSSTEKLQVSANVIPRVTCDLHTQPVHFNTKLNHLSDLHLADPNFGQPKKIDILLGADVYADVLLHDRRRGPAGTPVAFETRFGWVLTGKTDNLKISPTVASHHVATLAGDDILRKFWELEERLRDAWNHSPEECTVVCQFAENHKRKDDGGLVVPLPKNPQTTPLGESRSSAARRLLSLERSLHFKNQFDEFATVMNEYMNLKHQSWYKKQTYSRNVLFAHACCSKGKEHYD